MKRVITCSCGISEEMPVGENIHRAAAFKPAPRINSVICRTCGRPAKSIEVVEGEIECKPRSSHAKGK